MARHGAGRLLDISHWPVDARHRGDPEPINSRPDSISARKVRGTRHAPGRLSARRIGSPPPACLPRTAFGGFRVLPLPEHQFDSPAWRALSAFPNGVCHPALSPRTNSRRPSRPRPAGWVAAPHWTARRGSMLRGLGSAGAWGPGRKPQARGRPTYSMISRINFGASRLRGLILTTPPAQPSPAAGRRLQFSTTRQGRRRSVARLRRPRPRGRRCGSPGSPGHRGSDRSATRSLWPPSPTATLTLSCGYFSL